jgi:hypothetical protein
MSEKQEADEFDDADDDALEIEESEAVDLARLTREMDQARRRGARNGVPACWQSRSAPANSRRISTTTRSTNPAATALLRPDLPPHHREGDRRHHHRGEQPAQL